MAPLTTSTSTHCASGTRGTAAATGRHAQEAVGPLRGAARRSGTVLLALVAALALTGAACGGSDRDESSGDDAATSTADATGSGSSEPSTTAATTTIPEPISFEEASAAYESCLATNGSGTDAIPTGQSLDDLAELGSSPEALAEMGIDQTFMAAHLACWPAFDAAIDAGATPPTAETTPTTVDPLKAEQMAQAVQCLNERGWDFLEPGVETGPLTMEARSADFDWDDPGFLRDQQQCQHRAGMMG
jgi:hypothetical protein